MTTKIFMCYKDYKKYFLCFLILLAVFSSMCTEKQEGLHNIRIGNHVYVFTSDIREAMRVSVNEPMKIKKLIDNADRIDVVFNASEEDNKYFAVVGFNIVSKLQTYYASLGWAKDFRGMPIENATFQHPTIFLRGPSTGATNTSVWLLHTNNTKNIIIVQGKTFEDMEKAGDKLVLTVLGVNEIVTN